MTDFRLPDWAVPSEPRATKVVNQKIDIRDQWWSAEINRLGLDGTPPASPSLTRAEVWSPDDDVFSLLWRALAWGSGPHLRNNKRRLDSIAADPDGARKLLEAAREEARRDPEGAYQLLMPNGRAAIKYLGPAFFTKFLYFAGGGDPLHRCLILDERVATSVCDHCGATWFPIRGWYPETYAWYCDQLAQEAKTRDRAADEIELLLFKGHE
ncbi:hypothetical protein [Kutzneria buriramensis]|uniref:Uncharacterized protein n=1 Tax=Kutzneria buriramensis TaxID=1045776 RepID=A0A3E0GVY3_9PSEU|nr:hypothetical protein [Kutzneria buriramensis]REH28458.1 hypothetical protein BCF44_12738 [Kutzneria buriramensis]